MCNGSWVYDGLDLFKGVSGGYASAAAAAIAAAEMDFPTTKPLRSPAIRRRIQVPFNIFNISSILCWFSSAVNVDARMEKHWRTRAAVSSMDCYYQRKVLRGGYFGLHFRLDDGEDGYC